MKSKYSSNPDSVQQNRCLPFNQIPSAKPNTHSTQLWSTPLTSHLVDLWLSVFSHPLSLSSSSELAFTSKAQPSPAQPSQSTVELVVTATSTTILVVAISGLGGVFRWVWVDLSWVWYDFRFPWGGVGWVLLGWWLHLLLLSRAMVIGGGTTMARVRWEWEGPERKREWGEGERKKLVKY